MPGYQIGTWTLPLPTRLLTRKSLVIELVLSRGGATWGVCSCCCARFLPLLPARCPRSESFALRPTDLPSCSPHSSMLRVASPWYRSPSFSPRSFEHFHRAAPLTRRRGLCTALPRASYLCAHPSALLTPSAACPSFPWYVPPPCLHLEDASRLLTPFGVFPRWPGHAQPVGWRSPPT